MARIINCLATEEQDIQDIVLMGWTEEEVREWPSTEIAKVAKTSRQLQASAQQQKPRAFTASAR